MQLSIKVNWRNFHLLSIFLGLVVLMGGSSRPDIASLVVLRPVAIVVLAMGCITLRREHVQAYPVIFSFAAALVALVLLYLVPLPYVLWSSLPGRELVIEVDQLAGLGQIWRPMSMAPDLTWNAFYALAVPLAVLVHGVQLSKEDLRRLAVVLIGACAASSVLALLQLLGAPDGPAYLYRVTNQGAAVGFFANRNHQALFLAAGMPILAAYAASRGHSRSEDRRRLFVCIALTLLILPLLLVTGSRAGLVVGVLGLFSMPFIYRSGVQVRRKRVRKSVLLWVLAGISVAIAGAWTVLSGRAEALQRLLATVPGQELRYEKWAAVTNYFPMFFPVGPGAGTYEDVFAAIEPASLLTSSYSNHAHNDWLEAFMTTGYLGGLLMVAAIAVFGVALWRQITRRKDGADWAFGWAGLAVILLSAIASGVDYPLRTPIIASLFVIACLWAKLGHTAAAVGGTLPRVARLES